MKINLPNAADEGYEEAQAKQKAAEEAYLAAKEARQEAAEKAKKAVQNSEQAGSMMNSAIKEIKTKAAEAGMTAEEGVRERRSPEIAAPRKTETATLRCVTTQWF